MKVVVKSIGLVCALSYCSSAVATSLDYPFEPLLSVQQPRPFSGHVVITRGRSVLFSFSSLVDTNNKQFMIGSLSKQITAMLVAIELRMGRLSLHKSIRNYVDGLPEEWGQKVTIANLLNHTSGLTQAGVELSDAPEPTFIYSNWGYQLLAQAVESVSGKSYAEHTKQLFEQCSMPFAFAPSKWGRIADALSMVTGFIENSDGERKPVVKDDFPLYAVPSGGIVASAADLVEWNDCIYRNPEFTEYTQLLTRPTSSRQHRWGELGYGAGLQITMTAAGLEYSHSGYVPGYISTMSYYPKHDVSLVLLENVSWSLDDMARVFGVHDQVRNTLIEALAKEPQNSAHTE